MTNGTFGVAEGFGDQMKIKSVDLHPVTKRIVFYRTLPDQWWSHTIRFDDAPAVLLNEQRLYKIRWDVPTDRPKQSFCLFSKLPSFNLIGLVPGLAETLGEFRTLQKS
tara:strand:+ start:389 stop:712 length:324 start_codon:yes stop_codon:yes gene_type:complete